MKVMFFVGRIFPYFIPVFEQGSACLRVAEKYKASVKVKSFCKGSVEAESFVPFYEVVLVYMLVQETVSVQNSACIAFYFVYGRIFETKIGR